jgi:hypothetical protein
LHPALISIDERYVVNASQVEIPELAISDSDRTPSGHVLCECGLIGTIKIKILTEQSLEPLANAKSFHDLTRLLHLM